MEKVAELTKEWVEGRAGKTAKTIFFRTTELSKIPKPTWKASGPIFKCAGKRLELSKSVGNLGQLGSFGKKSSSPSCLLALHPFFSKLCYLFPLIVRAFSNKAKHQLSRFAPLPGEFEISVLESDRTTYDFASQNKRPLH